MKRYFNRELSWIEFNNRVLNLAEREEIPLLERLKYLAIVSSNFDEFFMVRVANAKNLKKTSPDYKCPSGLSAKEQLEQIYNNLRQTITHQQEVFNAGILPALEQVGIQRVHIEESNTTDARDLKQYFDKHLYPLLSPVRIEEGTEAYVSGHGLHIGFQLRSPDGTEEKVAVVSVPRNQDRFFWHRRSDKDARYTCIEDIITGFGASLFPGFTILDTMCFRITREADMSVDEQRDEDFMQAMAEVLDHRKKSAPIRLEYTGSHTKLVDRIIKAFEIDSNDVYALPGPLNYRDYFEFLSLPGFAQLRYPQWDPVEIPYHGKEIFTLIADEDLLLHHPYQSFSAVEDLIRCAAKDSDVLSIKMTLYRTSGDSPIVTALRDAALNGKHVTVFVELKARFDEKKNLEWVQQLETAGVIVVYGIAHLKVHAKMLLIIRNEYEGIKRYVHLSTGNYNESTAKIYTDLSLLTSDETIANEVSMVFNAITGYSSIPGLTKLAMAPSGLKLRLLQLIKRETEKHTPQTPGLIRARINSLADTDIIDALYEANKQGVKIELNVRGICMLVPGIKGLSENISVTSIVDRYLEHTRVMYFFNAGSEEIYLSSADWMPRNLERRVELLFPVEGSKQKNRIKRILDIVFADTENSFELLSDGSYKRKTPDKKTPSLRSQEQIWKEITQNKKNKKPTPNKEFIVRRKPL